MFREIVRPDNNESSIKDNLRKIGITHCSFIYSFEDYVKNARGVSSLKTDTEIEIRTSIEVSHKSLKEASKHSNSLIVRSSENDRFFIESGKIRMIYGFGESYKKDYLHQRASGLNHILCNLASRNGVFVGFSYGELLKKDFRCNYQLIGRLIQNLRLCKKYNVKTAIGSFSQTPHGIRSPNDVMSLFRMMGMEGDKIKEAMSCWV